MFFNSKKAFSLLEVILALLIMGVLFSFALPKFTNYQQSSCMTKLQMQIFNFKIALKKQINQTNNPNIDLMGLYTHLDLKPSNCSFQTQKNGFIAINGDKKNILYPKKWYLRMPTYQK